MQVTITLATTFFEDKYYIHHLYWGKLAKTASLSRLKIKHERDMVLLRSAYMAMKFALSRELIKLNKNLFHWHLNVILSCNPICSTCLPIEENLYCKEKHLFSGVIWAWLTWKGSLELRKVLERNPKWAKTIASPGFC